MGGPAEASGKKVQEVALGELFPFKGHSFKVQEDEVGTILSIYVKVV